MGAGVYHAGGFQSPPDVEIQSRAFALPIGPVGAADVGALRPGKPQPAEIVEGRGHEFLPAAVAVEVLDPHHEPGPGRPLGGDGKRLGMPDVEQAGRGGGEAAAAWHGEAKRKTGRETSQSVVFFPP